MQLQNSLSVASVPSGPDSCSHNYFAAGFTNGKPALCPENALQAAQGRGVRRM